MRLQEHSFVCGASVSQAATTTRKPPRTPPHPIAIPPISSSAAHAKQDGEEHLIPADPNISNAWIPGPIGGLEWSSDHETTLAPSTQRQQDSLASPPGSTGPVEPMPSVSFRIEPASTCHPPRPSSNDNQLPKPQDGRPFAQYNGYYLYETFEPGKASAHQRMEDASCQCAGSSASSSGISCPRCPRCEARRAYLDEVGQRERQRESVIPDPGADDNVEGLFKDTGMGRRGADGSFDLSLEREETPPGSTPNRPPHDPSRAEACDDGIIDTIVTGGVSTLPTN